MFGFLRWFKKEPAAAAAIKVSTTQPPVERVPSREFKEADFAAYQEALKLELPAKTASTPEEDAAVKKLAERIRTYFQNNRPGPESFPSLSMQVVNLLSQPEIDAGKLAQLITRDPALTAMLLRVANSVMYRGVSQIATVKDAVARIGLDTVAQLVGGASARTLFAPKARGPLADAQANFFQHALTCALTSSYLALQIKQARSDQCYLGGLLHDVGRSLALAAVTGANGENEPLPIVLRAAESIHAELGAEAHKLWELPEFALAIAAHHHDAAPSATEREMHVVRLVSALQRLHDDPAVALTAPQELQSSATALKLDPGAIRSLNAERKRFAEMAASLTS